MKGPLSIDFETRALADLKKQGVYRYAEDALTDVICLSYSWGDPLDVRCWEPKDGPLPHDIITHIEEGGLLQAWNATFERLVWREVMVKRYGAPPIKDEQWDCTMARAMAMALPRALEMAAIVLKIREGKDKEGNAAMRQATRPIKFGKKELAAREAAGNPVTKPEWDLSRELIDRVCRYCDQDVRVEMELAKLLAPLPPREMEIYRRTLRKNDRGITLDVPMIDAAQEIVDEGVRRAEIRLKELSGGAIEGPTKRAAIVDWLNENDIETASIAKPALKELLERDLTDPVREVLELRSEVGRSSVAKLKSMKNVICRDGAAHGLLLYYGATTGRESGMLLQPQNFARGDDVPYADLLMDLVAKGRVAYDDIDMICPPVAAVSALLRPMMTARPGHKLIAGDYSAIEARVLNLLAGQDDVVQMFRDYDRTGDKSREPYTVNAMRFYNLPVEKIKKIPHRQAGKFQELGCGYGMGGEKGQQTAKDTYGLLLTREEANALVKDYRERHSEVVDWWYNLNDACMQAVRNPGSIHRVQGDVRFTVRNNYLMIVLPTGRILYYAAPAIALREMPWSTPEKPDFRDAVSAYAVDNMSRRWAKYDIYGGLLAENIVQAVSRDIMMDGEQQLEVAGYPSLLTVHDEIVAEVEDDFGSTRAFEELMVPQWCREKNWPIVGEAWAGARYRK